MVNKRELVGGRWSSKESWWEVVIKRELVGNGQQKRASGRYQKELVGGGHQKRSTAGGRWSSTVS